MFFGISLVSSGKWMLFPFLKVLIVLYAKPVTAPLEAIRFKHFFAKVIFINFVWKIFGPVHKIRCRFRLNVGAFDVRILQRIDVDSHAESMFRKCFGVGHSAAIEA